MHNSRRGEAIVGVVEKQGPSSVAPPSQMSTAAALLIFRILCLYFRQAWLDVERSVSRTNGEWPNLKCRSRSSNSLSMENVPRYKTHTSFVP